MSAKVRKGSLAMIKDMVVTSKPVIEVTLTDDQKDVFMPQYTSLDEIKGEVSITASSDTSFDNIYVSFEGSTRTWVEKHIATPYVNNRSEAHHIFVRLIQPLDRSAVPSPPVLEARKVYKFPFTFVVPDTLLPQSCTHSKHPDFPEDAHMSPPPSFGDLLAATMGKAFMNDMAPDMSKIAYSVRARITSGRGGRNNLPKIIAEGSKKLRVIPATEEQPPLDVLPGGDDRYDYKIRREKTIKKGTFKGKLGRVVAQSAQPQSLKLPFARGPNADCDPTTMATVNVRFDPINESLSPPDLNTLQAKFTVATFFASEWVDVIPTKVSDFHGSDYRGVFTHTLNLSSLCLSNIEWEKHDSSTSNLLNRGDSGIPTTSEAYSWMPTASEAYKDGCFYTARIVVPVSLPKGNKILVPSFHSCLVSRIYALDLYLSFNTPNPTFFKDPTIHLKLPIQVSSEGNPNAKPVISAQVWCIPSCEPILPDFWPIDLALKSVISRRNKPQ